MTASTVKLSSSLYKLGEFVSYIQNRKEKYHNGNGPATEIETSSLTCGYIQKIELGCSATLSLGGPPKEEQPKFIYTIGWEKVDEDAIVNVFKTEVRK